MLQQKLPNALKSIHIYLAIVIVNLLIDPVNCRVYRSNATSNLMTQTLYRYSKEASFPNYQSKECLAAGSVCYDAIYCCQNGGTQLACGKFGSSDKTCQPCIPEGESCTVGDSMCCSGFSCDAGACVSTGNCRTQYVSCYPGDNPTKCCPGFTCITNEYSSCDCARAGGGCNRLDSTSTCCPGFYCESSGSGDLCVCDDLNDPCDPSLSPSTCCGDLKCDAGTNKCANCIAISNYCHEDGDTRDCCSSLECTADPGAETSSCCKPTGTVCNTDDPDYYCCPGLKCKESGGIASCQSNCVGTGNVCTEDTDICCDSSLSCNANDPDLNKCCASEDDQCVPGATVNTCCDGLECIDIGGSGVCKPPCFETGDSCEAPGDPRTCCSSLQCDSVSDKCCDGRYNSCDPDSDTCCSDLECITIEGSGVCQTPCLDDQDSCNVDGDPRSCCEPLTCEGDQGAQTCQLPCTTSGNSCASDPTNCCDGLTCEGDTGAETCQLPCTTSGNTCASDPTNCCGGLACDSQSQKCCGEEESTCDPATATEDTCCGDLECLTIDGISTCSKPCFDGTDSCNVDPADDTRKCCSPLTCDSVADKCCAAAKVTCDPAATVSTCCDGLTCDSQSQECCTAENTACDITAREDTCCEGFKCVETDGVATCQLKCADAEESCSGHGGQGWGSGWRSGSGSGWGSGTTGSDPCCAPLSCDSHSHKCCAGVGVDCDLAPCCRGMECDSDSNVCIEKPCVPRGTSCGDNDLCCRGLTCDSSSNICLGDTWTQCNSANPCSSGHKCENSMCKPSWCFSPSPYPFQTICLKGPSPNNSTLSSK